VLTVGLAGPVIVGAAVGGAVAIGFVAVGDVMSGSVSSFEEYLKQGLVGAVVGGLCSGLNLLNSTGKAIGAFKFLGNCSGPLKFLSKLANPVSLKVWQTSVITGVTETCLDYGWRGISPSYDVDVLDMGLNGVLNIGGGFGGGKLGDVLDNARRIKITKSAKLLEEFSQGNAKKLHGKLRALADKYGISDSKQLSNYFGVGDKKELGALLANMSPKMRLEMLLKKFPELASDIGIAQAFEGIPASVVLKRITNGISDIVDDALSDD
jgi:hypothetical protein